MPALFFVATEVRTGRSNSGLLVKFQHQGRGWLGYRMSKSLTIAKSHGRSVLSEYCTINTSGKTDKLLFGCNANITSKLLCSKGGKPRVVGPCLEGLQDVPTYLTSAGPGERRGSARCSRRRRRRRRSRLR